MVASINLLMNRSAACCVFSSSRTERSPLPVVVGSRTKRIEVTWRGVALAFVKFRVAHHHPAAYFFFPRKTASSSSVSACALRTLALNRNRQVGSPTTAIAAVTGNPNVGAPPINSNTEPVQNNLPNSKRVRDTYRDPGRAHDFSFESIGLSIRHFSLTCGCDGQDH
jgi:hypothetical protein